MAPIRKTAKRSVGPTSYPSPVSTFSKRDKQAVKHSLLLSKIAKSAPGNRAQKRRRPNKKLVATLETLADALPDDEVEAGAKEIGQARVSKRSKRETQSLKSGKGVMKKRAKLEAVERQRMGLNLAAMATAKSEDAVMKSVESGDSGVADRWAALRRHVEQNMEKKEEFAG